MRPGCEIANRKTRRAPPHLEVTRPAAAREFVRRRRPAPTRRAGRRPHERDLQRRRHRVTEARSQRHLRAAESWPPYFALATAHMRSDQRELTLLPIHFDYGLFIPMTPKRPESNTLYYGDNLEVLRRYIKDETVDLIYLDPPFKSDQDYNVLFAEHSGERAAAQIKAFKDTWRWDLAAEHAFADVMRQGGRIADMLNSLRGFLGQSDMMAYLAMMAPRLIEIRRVLKSTGSIYLHCDPTASHYLKLLMDAIFGPLSFRNEIVWRRTGSHGKSRRFGPIHDIILFYCKSSEYRWNVIKKPYMKGHVDEYLVKVNGHYRTQYYGNVLTGAGTRNGESGKPWKGIDPTAKGRHWAIPSVLIDELDENVSGMTQHEKLDILYEKGFIKLAPGEAWPIYEHTINPERGQAISDIWSYQPYTEDTVFGTDAGIDADVRWMQPRDKERMGYPTQKPEGLLERILEASSRKGDVVLDPFCGCGTAVAVAQRLDRQWIGIDITHLAIGLIKRRLRDAFKSRAKFAIVGEPTSLPDAQTLAGEDRYQFQWWALGLVGARPVEEKKGADRGIDGKLFFEVAPKKKFEQVIFSVKSGGVSVRDIRDLVGVIEREKAAIGVLITLEDPSKPMRVESVTAGFYEPAGWNRKYPRLQILTIEDLLGGKSVEMPPSNATYKRAALAEVREEDTPSLFNDDEKNS